MIGGEGLLKGDFQEGQGRELFYTRVKIIEKLLMKVFIS